MTSNLVPLQSDTLMERILELSADAQIKRRETLTTSNTFQHLTGAIIAYGNVLRVLTKPQEAASEQYFVAKATQSAAAANSL